MHPPPPPQKAHKSYVLVSGIHIHHCSLTFEIDNVRLFFMSQGFHLYLYSGDVYMYWV